METLSFYCCAKFEVDWIPTHVQNSNFVWWIFPNMVTEMLKFDVVSRRAAVSVIYHWKAEELYFSNVSRKSHEFMVLWREITQKKLAFARTKRKFNTSGIEIT